MFYAKTNNIHTVVVSGERLRKLVNVGFYFIPPNRRSDLFAAMVLLLFLAAPSIAEAGIEGLIPKGVNWSLAVRPLAPQPDKGAEKQVSEAWQAGEHQPNQPLAPGSLMKLLISGPVLAAGLELPTRLSRDQAGNLYFRGSGNVLLTADELAAAVYELSRKRGK